MKAMSTMKAPKTKKNAMKTVKTNVVKKKAIKLAMKRTVMKTMKAMRTMNAPKFLLDLKDNHFVPKAKTGVNKDVHPPAWMTKPLAKEMMIVPINIAEVRYIYVRTTAQELHAGFCPNLRRFDKLGVEHVLRVTASGRGGPKVDWFKKSNYKKKNQIMSLNDSILEKQMENPQEWQVSTSDGEEDLPKAL